jgi:hypothetical protein
MSKKNNSQLHCLVKVMGIFFLLVLPSSIIIAQNHYSKSDPGILQDNILFSIPVIRATSNGLLVEIAEASSFLPFEGFPQLPVHSITYEFPVGTHITSIEVSPLHVEQIITSQPVLSVPKRVPIGMKNPQDIHLSSFYSSDATYPLEWFSYSIGAGLNENNRHVVFCSVHLYPIRYTPHLDLIQYVPEFSVSLEYETKTKQLSIADEYDLLIITPEAFLSEIQPLVDHKNIIGVRTTVESIEDISTTYPGRDIAEKMKYCVKNAIEQGNISYVLLLGDIKKVPTRITYASPWEPDLLSDLYFADVYNADFTFCGWDSNENDRFGETEYMGGWPPQIENIDGVDLYADVHVGRLACSSIEEVSLVVDKIITYETNADNSAWFRRIALAGGDTFPIGLGGFPFIYEGEITNQAVADVLPDFEHIKLWASKYRLSASSFNKAINDGVGFVTYAGHGFEHGWGTYRPNSLRRKMTFTQPLYYTPFIQSLSNQDKLPIIFFDACLTAKLDFNVTDLLQYYRDLMEFLIDIGKIENDPSIFYPCFAWRFLTEENGGAIATIGATRSAYTWVDTNGVHGGAGYLDLKFFEAYEDHRPVGMMLTLAQNEYINNVYRDYFTIEEYILIGDPSLQVGGIPQV